MEKSYKSIAAAKKAADSYIIPMVVAQYRVSRNYVVVVPAQVQYIDAAVVYSNAAAAEAA